MSEDTERKILALESQVADLGARVAALEPFAGWLGLPCDEFDRRWPEQAKRWQYCEDGLEGQLAVEARAALGG